MPDEFSLPATSTRVALGEPKLDEDCWFNGWRNRIAVSPRECGTALGIGLTSVYKLLGEGELVSYLDGRSRKILVSSILARIRRRIEATASLKTQVDETAVDQIEDVAPEASSPSMTPTALKRRSGKLRMVDAAPSPEAA